MRKHIAVLFLLIMALIPPAAQSETVVPVWTYYDSLPLGVDAQGKSLTMIISKILSDNSSGKWRFTPEYLPRKRIDHYLAKKEQEAIILWGNPIWFGDKDETRYAWTQRVVWGANEVVSRKNSPVEYSNPESLIGKRFGGVAGHRYVGIDDLVKTGKIRREDANSFSKNLSKLMSERVDVIVIPRGELFYTISQENLQDKLHISSTPHQKFERKILVTSGLLEVRDYINSQLQALLSDKKWLGSLEQYGLQP
ncbi:MAG: transporter substrate-binding domain-containing protein [Pseudomonadales bacterium]|nr:transporter substrate-binding domain-containing protein [Pseudomonadales bacterium]